MFSADLHGSQLEVRTNMVGTVAVQRGEQSTSPVGYGHSARRKQVPWTMDATAVEGRMVTARAME